MGRNPVQGGSVVIRVSFRDEWGQFYVPVKGTVKFSLCALHKEKDTWEVVNNRHGTAVASRSVVDIVLQGDDLAVLPGCSLKRRVVLDWQYMRAGEVTLGRDTVDFEVVPLPVLDPAPGQVPPVPLEPFRVEDVFIVREAARPRIAVRFSHPVDEESVDEDSFRLVGKGGDLVIFVGWEYSGDKRTLYVTPRVTLPVMGEWVLNMRHTIQSVLGVSLDDGIDLEFLLDISWHEAGTLEIPVQAGSGGRFVVYAPSESAFIPFIRGVADTGPRFFVPEVAATGNSVGYIYGLVPGYDVGDSSAYAILYMDEEGHLTTVIPPYWEDPPVAGFVTGDGEVYLYPPTYG
jgi:hypothetical protein